MLTTLTWRKTSKKYLHSEHGSGICWDVTPKVKQFSGWSPNMTKIMDVPGLFSCVPDELLLMYDLDSATDATEPYYLTYTSVLAFEERYKNETGRQGIDLLSFYQKMGRYILDMDPQASGYVYHPETCKEPWFGECETGCLKNPSLGPGCHTPHTTQDDLMRSPWWNSCSAESY